MTTSTNAETCYQKYTSASDRSGAHKLLTGIIKSGYSVTVNDGEEYVLEYSTEIAKIKEVLATTGEDVLTIFDGDKKSLGWFHLIWDNGEDSPVSDYSSNEVCNSLDSLIC